MECKKKSSGLPTTVLLPVKQWLSYYQQVTVPSHQSLPLNWGQIAQHFSHLILLAVAFSSPAVVWGQGASASTGATNGSAPRTAAEPGMGTPAIAAPALLRPDVLQRSAQSPTATDSPLRAELPAAAPSFVKSDIDRVVASVAAVVDSKYVVLLQEVINPLRPIFEQARLKLPPEEYKKLELRELKKQLKRLVQREVLIAELMTFLESNNRTEMVTELRNAGEAQFQERLKQLAAVNQMSVGELLSRMEKEGSNLAEQKQSFIRDFISQIYLNQQVEQLIKTPTRRELLAYYDAHLEEYKLDTFAVWRHIQIPIAGNPMAAQQKAEQLRQQLLAGADFDRLAKEHSTGPTAKLGGLWNQTRPGSYAEAAVDQAIFQTPVHEISAIIRGTEHLHIIRVEERSDGGYKSFSEVQGDIQQKMKQEQRKQVVEQKLAEILSRHHIKTIFDDIEESQDPISQTSWNPNSN